MQAKTFLLGMVCGAAVTLAITHWNAETDTPTDHLQPDDAGKLSRQTAPIAGDASQTRQMPVIPSNPASSSSSGSDASVLSAQAAEPLTSDTPTSNAPAGSMSPSPPTSSTIVPLFESFFKIDPNAVAVPMTAQIHQKFDAETKDEGWAGYMETNLRDYLQRRQGMDRIDIFLLQCRTSICEIQAAGSAAETDSSQNPQQGTAVKAFQDAMSQIKQQPWGAEFRDVSCSMAPRDDRMLIVCQLLRAR